VLGGRLGLVQARQCCRQKQDRDCVLKACVCEK
jgi:hypothetical protein